MSEHLSAQQVDECLLGGMSADVQQHLERCAGCQARVDRMRQALAGFRHAVHTWSDGELSRPFYSQRTAVPARRWTLISRLSLVGVALVVCLVIALSWPLHNRSQRAAQSAADAALLSQIDAEVSRTVPSPMDPLTEFISNDNTALQKKARP